MRHVLLITLLLFALAGCGGADDVSDADDVDVAGPPVSEVATDVASDGPTRIEDLDGTTWMLADGEMPRPTLAITGTEVGGTDACNTYGGELLTEDGRITGIGPIRSTRKACEGHAHADFLTRLGAATAAEIQDDALVLTTPGGALRFVGT